MCQIKIRENQLVIFIACNIFFRDCLSLYNYSSTLDLKNPKLVHFLSREYKQGFFDYHSKNKIFVKDDSKSENKLNIHFDNTIGNKFKNRIKRKSKAKNNYKVDINDLESLDSKSSVLDKFSSSKKLKKDTTNNIISNLDTKSKPDNFNDKKKEIYINFSLTLKELALQLNTNSSVIIKWLFLKGIIVTINDLLDKDIIKMVAENHGFQVRELRDNTYFGPYILDQRCGKLTAPVVTFLGHVDHGKTSIIKALLDHRQILTENRSITQSLGSYEIDIDIDKEIKKLIIIDTPGHEAFLSMRKRGMQLTDIVVLVVAADDDVQAQTIEIINFIKSMKLLHLIAINKIDKKEANVNKIKKQLAEHGLSNSNNLFIELSAKNHININLLISSIINLAKQENICSDPSGMLQANVLEAYLDKKKGPSTRILLKNGSLKVGDFLVAGEIYGKIKAITDSSNKRVLAISSTTIANILSFTQVPKVGLPIIKVDNEKKAKLLINNSKTNKITINILNTRVSLYNRIDKVNDNKHINKILNLILKIDCQGSIEAIIYSLKSISQKKVRLNILLIEVGEVSYSDIQLAQTTNSHIIAFNLLLSPHIIDVAERNKINIKSFNLIYDLLNYITSLMLDLVDTEYRKERLGAAYVKNLFVLNKGIVAGCFIKEGKIKKNALFNLLRNNSVIYNGVVDSLKKFKDDVEEVLVDNSCGLMCYKYTSWQIGDYLEIYELKPIAKML